MKLRLIEGAENWWRFWSTRIQLVALALAGWMSIDPSSLLAAWNAMPDTVRDLLPGRFFQATSAILVALNLASIIARQMKQSKLSKPDA